MWECFTFSTVYCKTNVYRRTSSRSYFRNTRWLAPNTNILDIMTINERKRLDRMPTNLFGENSMYLFESFCCIVTPFFFLYDQHAIAAAIADTFSCCRIIVEIYTEWSDACRGLVVLSYSLVGQRMSPRQAKTQRARGQLSGCWTDKD